MGPVSFARLECGSRRRALELAGRLTAAGVKVELVAGDAALLVREEHAARARRIHRALLAESDDDVDGR